MRNCKIGRIFCTTRIAKTIRAWWPTRSSIARALGFQCDKETAPRRNRALNSDRLEPVSWANASGLAPIAVELAGCKENGKAVALPGAVQPTAMLGMGQVYYLRAHVPEKKKDGAKDAAAVSITATSTDLVLQEKKDAQTRVTIDLGDKPKWGYALTANGAILQSVFPAANVEMRADGTYLVKLSGTLDLSFINVMANRTFDLELRPIDEKNKLGQPAAKLSLTARSTKA